MSKKIRTRFAPSPTGFLHIGSLRTALYAYVLAKHNDGDFVLRIEDTDRKREVAGATKALQETLKKFNLDWDEFYVQSKRAADGLYKQYAEKLLKDGNAFYCQCDPKNAKTEGYSRVLRDPCRDKGYKSGAVKLRVPDGKVVSYYDFVHKKEISWNTDEVYDATLNLNIVTGVFSIDYDLAADIDTNYRQAPAPEIAISQANSYLAKAGTLPDDITGPTPYELLRINNNQFGGAISLSEANFVQVSLYRKDYDQLPSMPADPEKGNIWFIVGSSGKGGKIYAGEFHYFPVNEDQSATYPLKSVDQAWNELNSQQGYIASLGENSQEGEIKIRRVYLAYYDPGVYHEFYEPIYVFEGDNKFYGYVPAIADDYYGETSDTVIQE